MRQLELASHEREREFSLQNNDYGVSKSPKLPSFKEGEDVEVYLGMFERIACANTWNTNTWAPRLAALLTGVIGSNVPWLDCPASNALTWVITVTE